MADKKISELNAASAVYDTDDLPLVQSAETKQVNASIVKEYVNTAPTITGGTINSTPIGVSTQAAGSFTTLDSSSTTTLNGTTIPASKTLVSTDASQTLTNKTISGSSNTLSNISNASLTNSSITFGSTATSLGGTVSALNGVTVGQSTAAAGSFTTLTASSPSVISVSSSSDALRITQTGAGNALVVEDSANPDSTPFVILGDGTIVKGYTANVFSTGIQSVSTSAGAAAIGVGSFSASGIGAPIRLYHSRSGIIPDNTILQSGDQVGRIECYGADGTSYIEAARIEAAVDGTPGTNDMPGRLVFSTTKDGASSPTEAMRISSTQSVGIGATGLTNISLNIGKNITGGTTSYGVSHSASISSDVTTAYAFNSSVGTQAAAFTLNGVSLYRATFGGLGAGSAITNMFGYYAESTLTAATNNYGFYSNIASGSNRYNFYAAGTADNYLAGSLGIGAGANGWAKLGISGTLPSSSTATRVVEVSGVIPSTSTAQGFGYYTELSTQATAFTMSTLGHFYAQQGSIGSGSTVNNQYGFFASNGLTGATNNFGFYSNIASGTGRYNFYAAGTAANYFAGATQVANFFDVTTVTAAGFGLRIRADSADTYAGIQFTNNAAGAQWAKITSPASNVLSLQDGGSIERARLDSTGNFVMTSTGGIGYGTGSGGAVTQATSRTTGVTLNKTNGAITLVSAAGSATYQTFTVTNSTVAATDVIHVSQKSGTDKYIILVTAVAAGSFAITFATTGGTTTEQPVFNFAVIKAVAA